MLLLDTHTLIWLVRDDRRLGRRVKARIRGALGGAIAVSALSWWEIGCLAQRGRLRLRQDLASQRQVVLDSGIAEHTVSAAIAMDALALEGLPRDPIDRFIVATARMFRATLITSDAKILAWRGDLDRLDAQS